MKIDLKLFIILFIIGIIFSITRNTEFMKNNMPNVVPAVTNTDTIKAIQQPSKRYTGEQIAQKCNLKIADVERLKFLINNISQDIKKVNFNEFQSNVLDSYIDELTQLLIKYDYDVIMCVINNEQDLKKKYNELCSSDIFYNTLGNVIDSIEKIIDRHSKNFEKVFNHYMMIAQKFEKNCKQKKNRNLQEKIKRILEKVGKLLYKCHEKRMSMNKKPIK
jgi:hypothetical protein